MYHSWWFQLLLLLLVVNILVCSIERLRVVIKIVFIKTPRFDISRFRRLTGREEFIDNRPAEQLINIYEPLIAGKFGYNRTEKTDTGFCIFAEKWRWTRFGVYIVHLSVILLVAGGACRINFWLRGLFKNTRRRDKKQYYVEKIDESFGSRF